MIIFEKVDPIAYVSNLYLDFRHQRSCVFAAFPRVFFGQRIHRLLWSYHGLLNINAHINFSVRIIAEESGQAHVYMYIAQSPQVCFVLTLQI